MNSEQCVSPYASINNIFDEAIKNSLFPDAAFAVFNKDATLHEGFNGNASGSTWFDLASLTKLYTSTAILSVIEAGNLSLNQSAFEALNKRITFSNTPHLALRLHSITIQQLLSHTSGLQPWYPFYAQKQDFWNALNTLLEHTPPMPGMHYSDLNFMLLGEILKAVCSENLPEAFNETVFALLKETDARYLPVNQSPGKELLPPSQLAVSCFGNEIERKMCQDMDLVFDHFASADRPSIGVANDGNCRYFWGGVSGHAGLFAPVSSIVRLGQHYLSAADDSLFAQSTMDIGCGRGLGFECSDIFPDGCGHTGFTGTSLWISRKHNLGVAILSNRLAFYGKTPANLSDFRKLVHTTVLHLSDC